MPNNREIDLDNIDDAAYGTIEQPNEDATVACEFLTGQAGCGKTFEIKRRMAEDPDWMKGKAVLAATTGIAAVNLNAITINSLLKFFNTDSLRDNFTTGSLQRSLQKLLDDGVRKLCIDEVSMMAGEQLDLLFEAIRQVNGRPGNGPNKQLALILTGDFCQLPPINSKWAFEAGCWEHFAANTTRLTKQWRQSNPDFLTAINLIRAGKGGDAVMALRKLVTLQMGNDINFDGTTILGKNDEVDRYNLMSLLKLPGAEIKVKSTRWGKASAEWKNIPEELRLKRGALVMILANKPPTFEYVNGDLGHIIDVTTANSQSNDSLDSSDWVDAEDSPDGVAHVTSTVPPGTILEFHVKLKRNNSIVTIPMITREVTQRDTPSNLDENDRGSAGEFWDEEKKRWIMGAITYFPIRLAYASTVHKTQGLTLDAIQMDTRGHFFGSPAMMYVAISRARNPEGLRLVGTTWDAFAKKVSIDQRITPWL